MSIVKCYKIKEPRSASEQKQIDAQGAANVTSEIDEHYYVQTSADTISQVAVRTAVDPGTGVAIPASGTPHPENPFLFAMGFRLREIGSSGIRWIVTVSYQSINASASPVDEPATYTWEEQTWTAPIDTDKDGKVLANAAGSSYDPPITREFSDWLFTYSLNVGSFNTAYWSPFRNAINNDTFRGFPPYTCKVVKISAQSRIRGVISYFRLTITISMRDYVRKGQDGTLKQLGWIKVVENKGFYTRNQAADGKWYWYEIGDANLNPVSTPRYLSADGKSVVEADQANFREHRIFKEVKFADLEFGAPGITG